MKDTVNQQTKIIKRLLEKAIVIDPQYTDAFIKLAQQLEQEQQYEEAAQLLIKHSDLKPSSIIYQMIADNLSRLPNKEDEIFNYYSIALRLNPNNQKAIDGINNIGNPNKRGDNNSYNLSTTSTAGESSSYVAQHGLSGISELERDGGESDSEQWVTTNF